MLYIDHIFSPNLLYKPNFKCDHITLYGSLQNKSKIENVLSDVKKSIKKYPIYNQDYQVTIFIVNEHIFDIFKVFSMFGGDIDGINLFDRIFISSDLVTIGTRKNRYLYQIFVHEIVHSLQAKRYGGFIKEKIRTPKWVHEGYAVYTSRSKSYKEEESDIKKFLDIYRKSKFEKFNSYDMYRVYGLMVQYAIEKMHKSIDELHQGEVSRNDVLALLLKDYNISTKE